MWNDRLREAAYNSPDGTRITFNYEDVRRISEKKTAAFNFPDADGTYVQDLGMAGRKYPLRVIFWGDDHDLESSNFEALLSQKGQGKLEHPTYGALDVVPFGAFTRRDDLKSAANQSIIEVTFWETINLVYPTGQIDPASSVIRAVEDFNDAIATEFATEITLDRAIERIDLSSRYESLLNNASSTLSLISAAQTDVERRFNTIVSSVQQSINTLISEPLDLAFQTTLLIQAPSRAIAAISDRLSAYADLADSITGGSGAVVSPGHDGRNTNLFKVCDLYASSYVSGSILSTLNTQFDTKTQALNAAQELLQQFGTVAAWRDDNYVSLSETDTGRAYQQLQEAVALAAGFLVSISFSLRQERRIVVGRNRTIIDLVGELYGDIDGQLDFFINTNNLTGSEILEIPRGKEVVYYV